MITTNLVCHHDPYQKSIEKKLKNNLSNEKINTIICTSSLELGIDFKNIDQVLNIGTPKSINRLIKEQEDHTIISLEFQHHILFLQINLNI